MKFFLVEKYYVTRDGTKTETLACSYGLSQLISGPTHILQNSSSGIDLIFTSQLNIVRFTDLIIPFSSLFYSLDFANSIILTLIFLKVCFSNVTLKF